MSTLDLTDRIDVPGALPLTAAQRGIYYAQQIDPDVPMSVAAYVEFHGDVDAARLDRAVAETTVESESGLLRLVEQDDDEPATFVDTDRTISLRRRDFSAHPDPRAAALAWIDQHRSQGTDLFADDLLQTYLLTLGPEHSIWYCWGHHLSFDGYAAMYMMLRVAQRYTAAGGSPLPDADVASMAQISEIDAAYRSSDRFGADRDHWAHRLGEEPADLPATSFSTRAEAAAPLATVVSAALDEQLVARVRELAGELDVRPASVITAAVALYLARWNDADEAMVSLPVAVRDTDLLRTSAGLTSNVVPILSGLVDGDASSGGARRIGDYIRAVNSEIKEAVRHQRFRHEDITADVLGQSGGRRGFFGPMVNVMLFFSHIDFGDLRGELSILSTGPVEDSSVNVYDTMFGGMRLDLEANPHIYDHDQVRTHHARLVDFLTRFVDASVDGPVGAVTLPTSAECRRLEVQSAGPRADYGDAGLAELLSAARHRFGDRAALIDPEGSTMSYAQLHDRARAAARALGERGIGAESVVGVLLPRGLDQQVALHAVVHAGAVFLPLAVDEPADRRRHILETADPDLVIIAEGAEPVPGVATATLADLHTPGPMSLPEVHPDNGSYLLFTSGSTGRPKGVLVSGRALVNRLHWMQEAYHLTPEDRVLHKTPATFDVSVWEYFWPLLTGAGIVVAAPDGHRDPWYLRRVIADHRVTALHFVPSMLAAFSEALPADDEVRTALRSLRLIFTSGEALTPGVVAATAARSSAPIHNLYGPTEAAIDVTAHDHCAGDADVIPIGAPVANTAAHVLDRRLRPLPTGAVGELYLAGVQLARGYHRAPGLTADRFVASPFAAGERLYRTGDLVRRRPGGELEYLGRSDSQVKIRGQRVELGEIEAALAALDGVRAAAVVARDDLLAEPVLIGYASAPADSGRDLRAELAATLPAHMIPAEVVVRDVLPTSANGKLDRRALPEPGLSGGTRQAGFVAPQGGLEQLVHRTLCAVLGRTEVSMSDNLFDLGGTSLSATRIAARVSAATGVSLGLRAVFDADDVAAIAAAARRLGAGEAEVAVERPVPRAVVDGPIALSPAQHRLWLAARLRPESAADYNIPFSVRLIGKLDAPALVAALNDVVGRHEPLRTTVDDRDGTGYQHVHPAHGRLIDVGVHGPDDAVGSARDFAATPFDLAVDLPIRARIVARGDDDHTLTVVIHHLAADGWSLGPLAADLAAAYRARRAGHAPDWPALPVSYRQAGADQLQWLADPDSSAAAQLDFWAQTLAGAPAGTELPYDRPPGGDGGRSGAVVSTSIDRTTADALAALAEREHVTVFMVLHAAVAALLRTMSSTDDVVVGTPVSGRGADELDPLVGMFVNTLALRTRVAKSSSFADLLGHVRETDLAAFDNSGVPFDRVVAELNPPRSSSGQPFFDVTVAHEDAQRIELDFAGLSATAAKLEIGAAKFDLEFTFAGRTGTDRDARQLDLFLNYATELFDAETAAALAARCARLLQTVAADPDRLLGDISLLDATERLELVPAVGGGARPVEHLCRLLSAAVAAEPHGAAVVDAADGRALTYTELDESSTQLARLLIDAGAAPETYVAVSLPRGIDWVIALWAVAKSGAAWVPVDPGYPADRISFMLDDSGAAILLTDQASVAGLPAAESATTLVLDDEDTARAWSAASRAPLTDADRRLPLDVDQPAYLIYTSGTTGRPKGVVVGHRGLADFAAEQVARLDLTPHSRTLHLASPSFDASVLEVIMAVGAAATMHVAPAGIVGGRELAELMTQAQISHAFLTPALLTTMEPDQFPALRTLVIGGEAPNAEAVRRWAVGRRLINAYGPTEATVVATMSPPLGAGADLTIGRPIRGVCALVLDERLAPVAPGVVGELYLSGPHLARGYHGVLALTSSRFVANPYGEPGERMYRTGDLVRWRADHTLEFRGRADDQIKIRGHRIELGEIDAALVADPSVRDAVTVVHGAADLARLVAYVTTPNSHPLDDAALQRLRDRLSGRLPRHMIPSSIVGLDALPTTPIGKIDVRALPAPEASGTAHVPPAGDTERAVADEVADLLALDRGTIGRDDDFFELGGDSLLATRLAGALEHRFGTALSVRSVFDDARIAAIARLIDAIDHAAPGDPAAAPVPLRHDPGAAPEPGAAQQQLWFLNRLTGDEDAGAYHITFGLDLAGDLDTGVLMDAIGYAVDRHEPLRTSYPERDGRPTLAVHSGALPGAGDRPAVVAVDEWEDAARTFASAPFDLTVDPPIRVALHRIDTGDEGGTHHRLTVVIHHIAADGASMAPLARDIAGAYADLRAGRAPHRPPLPVTYRDYLQWQQENLDRPEPESATTRREHLTHWWRERLDGIGHAAILTPDLDDDEAAGRSAEVEVPFGPALRAALRSTADAASTTEFMAVHAVLAATLHRLHGDPAVHVGTGVSDLVIGTPVAGRPDPRLADLVGMFVNTVPLRTGVDGRQRFDDLLRSVHAHDLEALAHAELPFEDIVAATAPPRTGRPPIFGVVLTVEDSATPAALDVDGASVQLLAVQTGGTRFDLEVRIRDGVARFIYDAGRYSRARMTDLARRFAALAQAIADDPGRPIGDYPLVDDQPAGAAGGAAVAAEAAAPPRHLADLIDDAVAARPEAIAMCDAAAELTYAEAGRRADRWAAQLRRRGMGGDDVVAVAVERSIDSVLAVWAVAKAGAAALPIDTRHPPQRIRHMLDDSGARLGITTTNLPAEAAGDVVWVTPDDLSAAPEPLPTESLPEPPARHLDGCAYLVYTSGTTGPPKAVAVTHRGLAPFAAEQTRRYGVDAQSRTLHFASPSFDAAMLELLLAIDAAATMVIAPPSIYGGDELTEFLADQQVTHAFVTPAALAAAAPRELPVLVCLGVGGESFGRELVTRWGAGRRFVNCYGPTETTIVATMADLRPGDPITIGAPVDGAGALVLDSRLRPLPPHAPGDLYLTGPGLARGYFGRSAQTATRFVADPARPGARMYRTGDLASASTDGVLTYHGRSDRQVKVRGFRIELDEIDSLLAAHPDVAVAVTTVAGDGDTARLVAYVTAAGRTPPDEAALLAALAQRLPRPAVPSSLTVLDTIPTTVNGKIDHAALPAPRQPAAAPERTPGTPAEQLVADLVADALGLPTGSIGADDDFFALGGTSLQATGLVSRINSVHRGEPIRVRAVFDHPSVGALAALLDVDGPGAAVAADAPADPGRPAQFPLAPMQRRLWALHRADPDSVEYAMPFVLRLHGVLHADVLRAALADVAARHSALRTVYADLPDGPIGTIIDSGAAPELPVVRDRSPEEIAAELTGRPFDLTREPPLRAALVLDDERSAALVLVLHHIAVDGASLPIVVGDLIEAYRTRVGGGGVASAEAAVPDYRDYALAQNRTAGGESLDYWASVLSGAPAESSVPADPAQAGASGGGTVTLPVEPDLRVALAEFAREHSTSAFSVLHASLILLLHRLGAGEDLVIGTPVDTRGTAAGDYRGAVGMFVNTVALRTAVRPADSVQALIDAVRTGDLDAWDRIDAPFDDVVSAVNPPRLPGRSPLFQVALSVHEFGDGLAGVRLPVTDHLQCEVIDVPSPAAKFDLQFTATGISAHHADEAALSVAFARNRYSEPQARELGIRLLRTLRAMLADPQRVVGDLPITGPLEVAALSPVRGRPAAAPRTYAELLDAAAARNPEGIAVTSERPDGATVTLTYRELAERADRLARLLLAEGAADTPEAAVAVALPRSIDAVIAIWAIVRTGAAYVPVDPTYPADRIAHMLADSGASLVVTSTAAAPNLPGTARPLLLDEPAVSRRLAGLPGTALTDEELPRRIDVDQLAYVIYTSGSTGAPKGVLVPHRGLAAVYDELADAMAPGPDSRVLHFASPSFDASVLEFLLAAAGGSTLVIAPTDVYGGADLAGFLQRRGVTHAFITPAAVASMAPEDVISLTTLAVGGEAVTGDLVRTWAPGRTLLNVYGPTETTVITTESGALRPDGPVTIGRPGNGVSALVLDSRLHPVPSGVAGELYLLGGQLTRGYHRRPELTAARYVAAPSILGPDFEGQRMYRTGDVVRWTHDEQLEYVGRADDQIQVRGFRVELGEIDDVLSSAPGVRAAVTVADASPGSTVLHSYLTLTDPAGEFDPTAARRWAARTLPRHMVPATITVLDSLPLTPVGKVDRKALGTPAAAAPASRTSASTAGADALTRRVVAVYSEVLGIDQVSPDDDFFDVGGNSLLGTTVVTRLREDGHQISVADLFAAPSAAELAATLAPASAGQRTHDGVHPALAPLLTLRRGAPGSELAPLFVVHPALGLSWSFTTLLGHVHDGRAVYGLQNPALSGAAPAAGIGELAADYVRRIREVAPHGPYRLLGWSLGGLIAQEAAVILQRAGETVERLILLDSYVLAGRPELARPESLRDLLGEFGVDASQVPEEPDPDTVAELLRAHGGPLADLSADQLGAVEAAFTSAAPLAAQWLPRVFVGGAQFVTATAGGPQVAARDTWAGRFTGELSDVRVDCPHAQMLLPENVAHYGHVVEGRPVTIWRSARRGTTHRKESQ
ncbi:amino acid adenylation domain-containing protein [Gordonia caeni]|uniref:Carrier domain-containing protein n=1 Tax=Gordonia caeni TaxID=1007097 RepID=A0ABP7NXC5_9ACTN